LRPARRRSNRLWSNWRLVGRTFGDDYTRAKFALDGVVKLRTRRDSTIRYIQRYSQLNPYSGAVRFISLPTLGARESVDGRYFLGRLQGTVLFLGSVTTPSDDGIRSSDRIWPEARYCVRARAEQFQDSRYIVDKRGLGTFP